MLDIFFIFVGSAPEIMNTEAYAEQNLSLAARKRLEMILQKEILFILQVDSDDELTICRKPKYMRSIAGGKN